MSKSITAKIRCWEVIKEGFFLLSSFYQGTDIFNGVYKFGVNMNSNMVNKV